MLDLEDLESEIENAKRFPHSLHRWYILRLARRKRASKKPRSSASPKWAHGLWVLLIVLFFILAVTDQAPAAAMSVKWIASAQEAEAAPKNLEPSQVRVDPAYALEVFARDLPGARSLARGTQGTIFVGTRNTEVFAIRDGKKFVVAKGLTQPNGVAFKDGDLYVAEISRILRFPQIESRLANPPKPVVLFDRLPKEEHHGWKFIRFAPDGSLFVPIGAPCNVCNKESEDPRFASILRFEKLDGSAPTIYARGVRNTVGFDWHPATKELWFTDNGRDWMGDDLPDCELDRAPKPGLHFGFPFCHAGVLDPEFGAGKNCADYAAPELKLGPHVAPLGMRFLDENTIFVALHGSWNRSIPIGYKVMRVTLKNGKPDKYEPIAEFMNSRGQIFGRPVDVEKLPDGDVLISDDSNGVIYRLRKKPVVKPPETPRVPRSGSFPSQERRGQFMKSPGALSEAKPGAS